MTKSIKFVVAAAAVLTSTVGVAASEERFTQNGDTYVYTKTVKGDRTLIDGRRLPSGSDFHLIVRGDKVSGVSGGQNVSFKAAEASGAASNATVLVAN